MFGLQESVKAGLSSTPSESALADQQLAQDLVLSETLRTELEDKIEALESQKSLFQQSVAESRGEVTRLEAQLKQTQTELRELRDTHVQLEKR